MSRRAASAADVAEANRRFYDKIATVYERVDSRRGDGVDHGWLSVLLERLRDELCRRTGRPARDLDFMDAGAGSGFLAMRAQPLFGRLTLVDISQAMLDRIPMQGVAKLCGDCSKLPVGDASMDMVGAFATLHHLHSPATFFAEAYRVLRPGGLLYTDHDIEQAFVSRFRLPLKLYRRAFDHGHDYLDACPEASEDDYALSEFHGDDGLGGGQLVSVLQDLGFSEVQVHYHWQGMGRLALLVQRLGLGGLLDRRGFAPIVRLTAVKP